MIPLIPRFSHISHIVSVLGIVCLATVLAGMIFVAARGNDAHFAPIVPALSPDGSTKAKIAERFGELPLSFEINQGQTDRAVKFLSHGPGYDLFLTSTEAVLSLPQPKSREGSVLRLKMIGANTAPQVEGHDELPGKVNYFTGNDRDKWRRNIPTYRKVYYKDVYPGIDIIYYGNQRQLEYDFLVAAGADPKVIKFCVEGAKRIHQDQQGNLLLALKHGEVRLNKPFVYQLSDEGTRSEVKGSYVINGNVIRFKVRGVDSGKPLVIDPVLSYSTTDPDGNTSEFSAGDVASAAGNVQFSVSSIRVIEDIGLATVTVLRKGGSSGTLTVDYATIDGTATANQDYTSTSGSLTFSNGETTKTLQIPILDDAVTEPDETFTVVLRAANLETLGAPTTLVVTLQDRSTLPVISVNAVSVVEGNTGTTTEALFTFTLSAATGRPVSVNYATQNSDAFGSQSCSNLGTDYETVSGTISFPPGTTSVTIPVKICGDNSAEATERFSFNLTSPLNAVVDFPLALGTIRDDDVLELLSEDSGPTAALDAVLMLRDPFPVKLPEWFTMTGPDRNTRVMIFVRGLQLNPGEFPSAVQVLMTDNNNLSFPTFAEDVRAVPNTDFTQVVFRLQDAMPAGTYTVAVLVHFRTSNAGSIRIAP